MAEFRCLYPELNLTLGKMASKIFMFTVRLLAEGPWKSCGMYLKTLWYVFELSVFFLFTLCGCIQAGIKFCKLSTPNLRGGDASSHPSCAACTSPEKWERIWIWTLSPLLCDAKSCQLLLPPAPSPACDRDNGSTACPARVPPADLGSGHSIHPTKGGIAALPWQRPASWVAAASYRGGENIPGTHQGCAETYLIFRTGGAGNTNEYLTPGVPFMLGFFKFLLHTLISTTFASKWFEYYCCCASLITASPGFLCFSWKQTFHGLPKQGEDLLMLCKNLFLLGLSFFLPH